MATWKYVGTVTIPEAPIASAIKDEWETTLKAETSRIYTALTTKISDETSFKNKLATPSNSAYDAFLQSVGDKWSITLIKFKQKWKLQKAYNKWNTRITAVFGGGSPTFPDTVTAKKDNLDELRYVLGAVGHRSLGTWEPASMAVLLARGDTRCATYFDTNDDWTGTLEACFDAQKGALVTPSLIAELVYATVWANYLDEAGETDENISAFLTTENAVINSLVDVALNTAHTPDKFNITLAWTGTPPKVVITAEDTE